MKGEYELPNDLYIVRFYKALIPPVYSLIKLNSCTKQLVFQTCIIIEAQGREVLCFFWYTRLKTETRVISFLFCPVKHCHLSFGKVIYNSQSIVLFPCGWPGEPGGSPHPRASGSSVGPGWDVSQGSKPWSMWHWQCTGTAGTCEGLYLGQGSGAQPLFDSSSQGHQLCSSQAGPGQPDSPGKGHRELAALSSRHSSWVLHLSTKSQN